VSSQANRVADEGGCIEVGVLLPSVLPSIHFGFSNFYILTFCMAKTLGQRESDQANRESSQANRVSSQANRVADEGGCIEVGDLLPSVLPSIHFGFSNFYIPYVLYGQNTRSAREFLSQPRKFPSQPGEFPSQPSGRRRRLYRGGRPAALGATLDTFWLFEFLYSLRFVWPKHSVSARVPKSTAKVPKPTEYVPKPTEWFCATQ
jgi:hypothetical protein